MALGMVPLAGYLPAMDPQAPRRATPRDLAQLLPLMRGLAAYEGYLDNFAVTEETLHDQGFRRTPPDFHALVVDAENGSPGELAAYLVHYLIPFTFRARPTLVVKELFVAEAARGRGHGEALLRAAAREAVANGCAAMKWQVARWNEPAVRFYEQLGAVADPVWVDYGVTGGALSRLTLDPHPSTEPRRQSTMHEQEKHYADKLAYEIDSADLHAAREAGERVVILDVRSAESFAREHIPGAVSFPHRTMDAASTARLDRDDLYVTYCYGIGCNGSTRGALNLVRLGFRVRELIGGIAWWKDEGYAVATGTEPATAGVNSATASVSAASAVVCDC
jgi:rhodanese-related sulfurtransferase/GNAT superfamily N-acetyltransferase